MKMAFRFAVQGPWDVHRWKVAVPTSEEAGWRRMFLCPVLLMHHLSAGLPCLLRAPPVMFQLAMRLLRDLVKERHPRHW